MEIQHVGILGNGVINARLGLLHRGDDVSLVEKDQSVLN